MADFGDPQKADVVTSFVRLLRDVRHVPIHFVQADERIEGIELESQGDLAMELGALVARVPAYQWTEIAGHSILYPRTAVWDAPIGGVQITGLPRLEAAAKFVAQVRAAVPELADLAEPPMIGDPRSPVYRQTVSLRPEGSILEHLVELAGPYSRIAFTIERGPFGDRVLHFGQVPE
jgi:hypothetical protein